MKKFILSFFLIAISCAVKAENVLNLVPFSIAPGTDTYVDIVINNETPVCWIQFDLYLPEGLSVYRNKSGNFITSSFALNNEDGRTTYYDEDEEDNVTVLGGTSGYNEITEGGVTYFRYGGAGDTPLYGNSGKVFKIRIKADASVPAGIYPIIIKNVSLLNNDETGPEKLSSTSYVVVGEPENATLALEGEVPSFVNEALASETAIGTLDLTKATASNGTFTYVDGRAVKAPADLKGKVAYKRSVSGLASICLPFAADIKAYTYSNMAGEYAIFDEVSNLAANTPAIVDANIDITVADATIGSVEGKTINSGYYLKSGNLCKVNGSAKIAPLRGCWDITAPVKGFKFNDADAILTVDANANEDIFNLNGVKLNKAQRGVNIIGGKKVMK